MSDHCFQAIYNEKPISIVLHYSRRHNNFYMFINYDIEFSFGLDYKDVYIYSHFTQKDSDPGELDRYRVELTRMGIQFPEQMFKELELDQLKRVGDRTVIHYLVDGKYRRKRQINNGFLLKVLDVGRYVLSGFARIAS